jgi:small-conductance mechanosensitive channel
MSMKTYNKNEVDDFRTTKFDIRMPFYIRMDVILIENKEDSYQTAIQELTAEQKQQAREETAGIDFLMKFCEDQNWLIVDQRKEVKELLNQLADYEEEIYEKDRQIAQIKNGLEQIWEKLFTEVIPL